jgi:hypothetical protein
MAETLSLMEFLQALLADAELRDSFADDPQGTLSVHGLAELTPDDVHDALVLVQDNQTVDYLDLSGAPTPPPPPTAGNGHEAAVEYLARYLAGPQQAAAEEPWPALDPDIVGPAPTGVPSDEPGVSFGTGFDDEYGAGTTGSSADHGTAELLPEPLDLAGHDPAAATDLPREVGHDDPGSFEDLGDFDDLGGLGDLGDLDEHTPTGHDVPDADPGHGPA